MDTDHQLIVRIKSFLNSTELINSPIAQELYSAYCQLNDSAARRLVECEVLLQRKQKIEAVVLAQQAPNLFDLIDAILFPERKLLLILADLYDWKSPDVIREESVKKLKEAVSGMDDLRPLLTEFRRIARTDQVENKLHLLREIYRIDKDNPEWKLPLTEVENKYVSQLIAEAQTVIQARDFVRLEQIYEELKNSKWLVLIPTIVLQKVEKIVLQHRKEEVQKTAAVIIDKISSAYGAFDLASLEDAVICWKEHCKKHLYVPSENEQIQFKEAVEYLSAEKEKLKKQQEHQGLLDKVIAMINSSAPLHFVEKVFSQAQSYDFEIPDYITKRVAQYRQDIERERKMKTFIKALKITGTAAVIILIISGGAMWGIQLKIENSQAENLYAAVKKGNIPAAQALLREIERKYPKLSSRPKISQAKAALQALESSEQERVDEFTRLIKELVELKKQWPPDKSLNTKIENLRKIAKTDIEISRVNEFSAWSKDAFRRRSEEIDESFLLKVTALNLKKDELIVLLNKNEFNAAEQLLSEIEKLHDEIMDLKDVTKELLADSEAALKSVESLRPLVLNKKAVRQGIADAKKKIIATEDFIGLELALSEYKNKIDEKINKVEFSQITSSLQDIAYLKAILSDQGTADKTVPARFAEFSYFSDAKNFKEYRNKQEEAKKSLAMQLDSFQKNINRTQLSLIRLKSSSSYIDMYVDSKRVSPIINDGKLGILMRRIDGTKVVLTQERNSWVKVTIRDEEIDDCKLIYPKQFSVNSIKESRAPHQALIEKFFKKMNTDKNTDIFTLGDEFLTDIVSNKECAPYWKLKLALLVFENLAQIDLSSGKKIAAFKTELQKLQALNQVAGNPLENKFLNEKIELFFKSFEAYDFSTVKNAIAQNKFIMNFYSKQMQHKVQYLGTALNVDGQIKFAVNKKLKSSVSEVLCFDGESGKCIIVGSYNENGFLIDREFQEKIVGRVLFTSVDEGYYHKTLEKLNKDMRDLKITEVKYPEFWPLNLRGEVEK